MRRYLISIESLFLVATLVAGCATTSTPVAPQDVPVADTSASNDLVTRTAAAVPTVTGQRYEYPAGETVSALEPASTPEAIQSALWLLTSQFRVDPGEVRLVRWEQVDWPNGCLGIPMRDACTEAVVPGYRIVAEIGGQEYEYRSSLPDAFPYRLLLADGPEVDVEEPALVWEGQEDNGCQSLALATDGRAVIGPCDAPQVLRPLVQEVGRPQQWVEFLARFAPFQADTPSGWVKFQGQGQEVASPAWQRAIAAWARLVRLEVDFGRSGASWGLALAWHQEVPDRPGYCRFLQVEMYGLAYASVARCEGGDPQDLGQGWVETTRWEQFDAWLQGRARQDLSDLLFYGTGTQAMSSSEIEALRHWAETVYEHLAKATP